MSVEELSHRLTAILAADVAEFSRLMADDERATIAALDEVRAVFRREIEANRGRIVDMAGDSVLALFDTATGAMTSALAVQQRLEAAAAQMTEHRRMRVRIGMHLAEVTIKPDGTAYADGVNIAARLQSIAPPGGICVGHTLYDTVKAKLPVQAHFAGHQRFKNIRHPIAAWQIASPASTRAPLLQRSRAAGIAAALARAASAALRRSARPAAPLPQPALDRKSIAVLPFTNLSDDKENAYFADGVQEELLCQLALIGDLKVISRTSVLEYRTRLRNMRRIGAELGAGSLVEGSVRRAGKRVRVTVQLIDATTDKHLWGNTYERDLEDIFAIQSELAAEIARALDVRLRPAEEARLARRPPTRDFEAYELFLRQQDLQEQSLSQVSAAADALDERISLLERAVQRDEQFALAWARLAAEHARAHFYSVDRSPERLARARQAIERARALAPDDVEVRVEAANVHYYEGDFTRAAQYFEELLRLAPHHVATLVQLALVRRRQGRWLDAHGLLEKAVAIDGRFLPALGHLRESVLFFRHFDEALSLQRRLIELQAGSLEAVCVRHEIEWLKTGSFATYDAWRASLPAAAPRNSARIWNMDFARATVEQDRHATLALLAAPPSAEPLGATAVLHEIRAIVLLANGERGRAAELAVAGLHHACHDLERQPDNVNFFYRVLLNRALLGQRDALLDEYRRWSALLRGDALAAGELAQLEPHMYALLGDRAAALASVERQLREPMVSPEMWSRALLWLLLGEDAAFRGLMSDPHNRAPMPIVNREGARA